MLYKPTPASGSAMTAVPPAIRPSLLMPACKLEQQDSQPELPAPAAAATALARSQWPSSSVQYNEKALLKVPAGTVRQAYLVSSLEPQLWTSPPSLKSNATANGDQSRNTAHRSTATAGGAQLAASRGMRSYACGRSNGQLQVTRPLFTALSPGSSLCALTTHVLTCEQQQHFRSA
eukprot:14525-Heterococcus_DN1.PRE.4